MPNFGFNPITGQLDLVGSGSNYIDGVVANPSLLPTAENNPPIDSVYLCKAGSGVWFVNRKPAGLYCRVSNGGDESDWQYLGSFPEINSDGNWRLFNATTTTKELAFNLANITAGNTRTIVVPDNDVVLPNQSLSTNTRPTFDGLIVGSEVGGYVTAEEDPPHKAQIVATGTQTPLVLVGGSGTFEFYKDATPSKVVSVGFATPGSAATDNLIFSHYAGTWKALLELAPNAAMDVKTGGIQFADPTTNSKKVLLSAANVSANTTRTLSAPDASGTLALLSNFLGAIKDMKVVSPSSDVTATSSTTLTNVSGMSFSVAANTTYLILTNLQVNCGAGGYNCELSFPSILNNGTTASGFGVHLPGNNAVAGLATTTATTVKVSNRGAAQTTPSFSILLVRTDSTGGTANFQWAQNASSAAASTISATSRALIVPLTT